MDAFEDPNYIAGCEARTGGDLLRARKCFELAAGDGNYVALADLCDVCDQLGDFEAVYTHVAKLQSLALMSAEISYGIAKLFEGLPGAFCFGHAADLRIKYLLNAAEIGNPMAQLEVASNYWFGNNGFTQSADEARRWVHRASRAIQLPEWATEILRNDV